MTGAWPQSDGCGLFSEGGGEEDGLADESNAGKGRKQGQLLVWGSNVGGDADPCNAKTGRTAGYPSSNAPTWFRFGFSASTDWAAWGRRPHCLPQMACASWPCFPQLLLMWQSEKKARFPNESINEKARSFLENEAPSLMPCFSPCLISPFPPRTLISTMEYWVFTQWNISGNKL